MENKKVVFVIVVVAVLALMAILFLPKSNNTGPILIPEEQQEVQDEALADTILPLEDTDEFDKNTDEEKEEKPEPKPVQKPAVKTPQRPTVAPVIKPIQVQEVVSETKPTESSTEKTTSDAGIINDAGEIVITREFKTQSPAKYSFVGYGEQKAPVK